MSSESPPGLLQRLASPFHAFGFWPALVYLANRGMRAISPAVGLRYHDWMVQPVPATPLLPEHRWADYESHLLSSDDPLIDSMPIRPDIRASRFAQGAVCLGTFRDGQLVAYIWFSFDTYDEDEARCTFELTPPETSAFDFDLYIFPPYRMGHAFAATWDGAARFLRERGVSHTFSRIDRFNQASAAAHRHLGIRRLGSGLVIQFGGLEVIFSSLAPRFSWLAGRKKRARIRLRA